MNKTFKVARSLTRGTVVTSEKASSYQGKAVKTVIAAAVASLVAGAAMAADVTTTRVDSAETAAATLAKGYENLTINTATTTDRQGNYGAVIVDGVSGSDPLVVANAKFNNNTSYTNKDSAVYGQGGALAVYGSNLKFINAQLSGNTAQGHGGAIVLQAADNSGNTQSQVEFNVSGDQNVVYAGNQAGSGYTKYEDMGGFAYLKDGSTLTLSADPGSSLTIGNAGAAQTAGLDSIASLGTGSDKVEVKGNVTINGSMEWFAGEISTFDGTNLTMATGFGSRVTDQQAAANKQAQAGEGDTVSGGTFASGSKLTVVSGASVTINDVLEVTGQVANSGAGTTVDVQKGGTFVVDGIKVTSYTYEDKDGVSGSATDAFGKGVKTVGIADVSVASGASSTVTNDVVVDAASTFNMKGNGTLNILGTVSTAADVTSGGNVTTSGGIFNIANTGTVNAAKLANAGHTTISNVSGNLVVTGTGSTNTGDITGSGTLTLAKGADLVNTGLIENSDLVVTGTLTNYTTKTDASGKATNTYGKVSSGTAVTIKNGGVVNTAIGKDEYFAKETTINEGGTFNLTELNSSSSGVATDPKDQLLIGGNSAITLNGGAVTLNGTAYNEGLIQIGSTESIKNAQGQETSRVYTGGTLTIAQGDYTADTVTLMSAEKDKNASGYTATLNVNEGASYTVGTLKVSKGDNSKYTTAGYVNVEGDLTVTKALATAEATDGAQAPEARFNIAKTGTLTVSNEALGLSINSSGAHAFASGSEFTSGSLTNAGTVVVTGLTGSMKKTQVSALKSALIASGVGLVNLGDITISDLTNDKGNLSFSDLTTGSLAGITTADMEKLAVDGVSGNFTSSVSVSNLLLANKDAKAGAANDVNVTLNGTGDLVQFVPTSGAATINGFVLASGASLTTTGAGAKIGAVKKVDDSASGTALNIQSGDLTVAQDIDAAGATTEGPLIDVAELNIADNAKLAIGQSRTEKPASGTTAAVTALYGAVNVGELNVAGTLDASQNKVTVTSGGDITGSANIKTLDLTGNLFVGDEDKAGTLVVDTFSGSGAIIADPAFVEGKVVDSSKVVVKTISGETSKVIAAENSIVSIGTTTSTDAEKLLKKSGFELGDATAEGAADNVVSSVLYVNGGKTVSGSATTYSTIKGVVASTTDDAEAVKADLTQSAYSSNVIEEGTLLVIDAATVDTKGNHAVFDKTLDVDGSVYFDNLGNGDVIKLSNAGISGFNSNNVSFTGDLLMEVAQVKENGQSTPKVAVAMQGTEAELADEFGNTPAFNVGYAYFADRVNLAASKTSSQRFADYLYTERNHDTFAHFTAAAKDMAALGATTGVQTLTMDAVNQMADTVADRTSVLTQRGQGVNVWADVNGGKFEAKKLFDGAGYSSDIYSGVLGLDYQFSCNAVLGAALTIGTADTDSKNTTVAASTDSDLVGFSVYASKTFADIWNVAADIGYLQASNEVSANGYGFNYKFDQDTDAFTVGVRGEVLTKAGSVNIVPHLGLRYTALSTDGFEAGYVTDVDDQNIFQMPVGVTVSADFETNGWTIAPKFDLSVVPTFGDKDADLKLGITGVSATDDYAVRVIDSNPVQAQLGVNATNGDWGFGLSYKLGAGSDERMNNSFNATVRYAF